MDVGDGDRAAKSANGGTTSYVVAILGLSQVLMETTGGQSTWYMYGHDLLAENAGEAWAWHLNDGLGSARQLVARSGPDGEPLDLRAVKQLGQAGCAQR